jgi:CheY-like chemotaxis protein
MPINSTQDIWLHYFEEYLNLKGMEKKFILVDDDPINNTICEMTIELAQGKANIKSFTNPEIAFDYIKSFYPEIKDDETILFLDLNMPIMTGWEFLERFDNLPMEIKKHINIYILSSTIDDRDKDRSYANKNVNGFLLKPLTKDVVTKIMRSSYDVP